jgi:hypothetical protein
MATYALTASTIASALALAACAATTANVQNPACLTQTGGRIAVTGTHCSAYGRSYTSDDISRTGATTAGEALRLLDPAITVHR